MPVFDDMKRLSPEIKKLLDELSAINRDELYGADRLTHLSFDKDKTSKEAFESTFDLFSEAGKCNLERIPPAQLTELKNQLNHAHGIFKKALALNLEGANPKGQRDQIVNELQASYPNYYTVVAPMISFATRAGTDFKKIEREARAVLNSTKTFAEKATQELNVKKMEIEEIITAMRSSAAESGVSQNSIHYKLASEHHEDVATRWLKATIGFGVGTLIYTAICASSVVIANQNKRFEFTYIEIALAVGLLMAIYGLRFCSKQYATHRHNTVVNGDKAKALATFLAFAEATDNPAIKEVLLQQASASIFSVNPSGYISSTQQSNLTPPTVQVAQKILDKTLSAPAGHA